jgi:hypothetical protein
MSNWLLCLFDRAKVGGPFVGGPPVVRVGIRGLLL